MGNSTDSANPPAPSSSPAVSVCIPAYNSAAYIGMSIESVLAQTFSDWELVIVDGGSSDNTLDIVSAYKDPRIRIFTSQCRVGPAENWNRSVRECRGRFIKLLCHDDVIYNKCLESQAAVLDHPANQSVVMTFCLRDIIDSAGRKMFSSRGFRGTSGRIPGGQMIRTIVRSGRNLIGEPVVVLFRASAFALTGGFDASLPYCIDFDFWCRLLQHGDAYVQPETLGAFRVSPESWSVAQARSHGKQDREFFRKIYRSGIAPVTTLDLWRGYARCTVDAYLRQALYLVYPRLRRK